VASVSVSHMILFIASMIIAASVAGVFTNSVDQLSQAIEDQGLQVADDVRTDIQIISDNGTGACIYDCSGNQNITVLIKNTGTGDLIARADQMDVLVNGQFQPTSDMDVELLGDAVSWARGEVVRLEVTETGLGSGDHRIKVIVNGDTEVFEFTNP
jgi:flagellar protein FlaG